MTKKTNHICSECLGEFSPKEIYIALKPNSDYNTLYCDECLKKLKITESHPYQKTRTRKQKNSD